MLSEVTKISNPSKSKNNFTKIFINNFVKFIREEKLIFPNDHLLVSVSGGLDSTVLLKLLAETKNLFEISLTAVHFNHNTRKNINDAEEKWITNFCNQLSVPLKVYSLDKPMVGSGLQEKWRNWRREEFNKLLSQNRRLKVVTGHHAQDNAETIIQRLISGSGQRGLAGIHPKRDPYLSPLLIYSKNELQEFARENNLFWVEDESNNSRKYQRNSIRIDVLPQLEKIRQGSIRNISTFAMRMARQKTEWDNWIAENVDLKKVNLSLSWLSKWPVSLQRQIIHNWVEKKKITPHPQLIENLLNRKDVLHKKGVFLVQGQNFIFNQESPLKELWSCEMPLEVDKLFSLGKSLAWSFLNNNFQFQNSRLEIMSYFRNADQVSSEFEIKDNNSLIINLPWQGLPWPLKMVPYNGKSAEINSRLKLMGVPAPYWEGWPLIVKDDIELNLAGLPIWFYVIGQAPSYDIGSSKRYFSLKIRLVD